MFTHTQQTKALRFADLYASAPLILPNVWDAGAARLIAGAGAKAIATAGQEAERDMCRHEPPCPSAYAPDHEATHLLAFHRKQAWGLRCNGVIVFDDIGELLPDGHSVPAHRGLVVRAA